MFEGQSSSSKDIRFWTTHRHFCLLGRVQGLEDRVVAQTIVWLRTSFFLSLSSPHNKHRSFFASSGVLCSHSYPDGLIERDTPQVILFFVFH